MLSHKKSLNILRKTNALLEGHFILSSGLHSSKYIQCAKLLSFPKLAEKICKSLANQIKKKYNTTLWMSLPDKPGQLGDISSLIGSHKLNISSLEMVGKNPNYINFKFKLIIRNLKNFTNFIAVLKQKSIKFKIIRHEEKRNAFTQKILKYFKKN